MRYMLHPLFLAAMLAAIWTFFVQNDPFFWDTVQLASKHAHFFYENHLSWAPLPSSIDSGHPPLLGYYLAVLWSIWGKTLAVSHWAIWPFLSCSIYFAARLGEHLAGNPQGRWLALLLFADPVLAGQSALVSPDTMVVAGLLAAVTGICLGRKWWVLAGVLLLCTASMRGMMVTAGLAFWIFLLYPFQWRKLATQAIPFLPGVVVAFVFLAWHYSATGWVGHFSGSSWAGAFERVPLRGQMRNMAVVAWRMLDFDRFFEWGLLVYLVFRAGWRTFLTMQRQWVLLAVSLFLFLTPSAILYKNLSAHRYFLPVFVATHILIFSGLIHAAFNATKKAITFFGLVLLLMLGNFWVYPIGISMDWDSTLAHWPYHRLRAEAIQYLDEKQIPFETVGTAFPNINTGEDLLLNGDFRQFNALDLTQNKWVLVSNIFNDIDKPTFDTLYTHWKIEKKWQEGAVVILVMSDE